MFIISIIFILQYIHFKFCGVSISPRPQNSFFFSKLAKTLFQLLTDRNSRFKNSEQTLHSFQTIFRITRIATNVPTVILVHDDFLVTYPKSAENSPSKLVFGLVRVLRRFWLLFGRTALKIVLSILDVSNQWENKKKVFLAHLKFGGPFWGERIRKAASFTVGSNDYVTAQT